MRIAIDFDGTIVDHKFPDIGNPVPDALSTIKELQEAGCFIALWTMRSGQHLQEAVDYLKNNGIVMDAVNESRQDWTSSPKLYAQVYIDDAALGCPLRENPRMGGRPYVDWEKAREHLVKLGVLE